ncbi:MAG: zinc-dependent alcohol dehydrogenase family protein [Verrucomicrobiota bacterium]
MPSNPDSGLTSLSSWLTDFGSDDSGIGLKELSISSPDAGEVILDFQFAPVNPADLNTIEGTYGIKPALPSPIGSEGIAKILQVGSAVEGLHEGDMVLPIKSVPCWQQYAVARAEACYLVHEPHSIEQASMLTVNPLTAWCLLSQIVKLEEGDWIIQNAATSGVGRAVIAIAQSLGIKTMNLVRREESIQEIKALGADMVLLDSHETLKDLKAWSKEAAPRLGFNAVGGDSAVRVAQALAPGGTHVTFGAMGLKPVTASNGQLIFKDLRFQGFWLTRWGGSAKRAQVQAALDSILPLFANEQIQTPVSKVYPLSQMNDALQAARSKERQGKILLDLR